MNCQYCGKELKQIDGDNIDIGICCQCWKDGFYKRPIPNELDKVHNQLIDNMNLAIYPKTEVKMNLKDMLTSREVSLKLKEAGIKQESQFFYDPRNGKLVKGFQSYNDEKGIHHWFLSAFLISELLEMLSDEEINGYICKCVLTNKQRIYGVEAFINAFLTIIRQPDKLAEVVLWVRGKKK